MRSRLLAALACTTALLAAACGGDTSAGEPQPAPSGSTSAKTKRLPKFGAPAVPAPLDVSGIAKKPCKALSTEQTNAFPGTLDDTHTTKSTLTGKGKSCNWNFQGDRYSLGGFVGGVVLPSGKYQGLSTVYGSKRHGALTTFRPIGPIAGYPAVAYASGRTIGDGYCRLAVGLRNDTAYRITTGLDPDHPLYDQPCQVAKKVATFVVQNLKEGR